MEISTTHWRTCSSCKKNINYSTKYYECSVSTCTGKRTGYVFCTVACWERHLPGARHRDAGAVEKMSPSLEAWKKELAQEQVSAPMAAASTPASTGVRRIVSNPSVSGIKVGPAANTGKSEMDTEILVVVSKMKQFISDYSEMNTSGDVAEVLSDMIRRECRNAIDNARADGRKTVMARDFRK